MKRKVNDNFKPLTRLIDAERKRSRNREHIKFYMIFFYLLHSNSAKNVRNLYNQFCILFCVQVLTLDLFFHFFPSKLSNMTSTNNDSPKHFSGFQQTFFRVFFFDPRNESMENVFKSFFFHFMNSKQSFGLQNCLFCFQAVQFLTF